MPEASYRWVAALGAMVLSAAALGAESDPLPAPKDGPRQQAIERYNEGVQLLLAKRYGDAQRRFEEALAHDDTLAEAHNNLAFSLRMQSKDNYERSLQEYGKALALNPRLAQAYMYRGVLFTQMGDSARAQADLTTLRTLDTGLAARLERAMAEKAREERDGIAAQIEY